MKKWWLILLSCLCMGAFSACDLGELFNSATSSSNTSSVEQSAESEKDSSSDKVDSVEDSSCGDRLPSEGLAYTLNDDGVSYSVTRIGSCTDKDIVIPSTYKNLHVTSIGYCAFV